MLRVRGIKVDVLKKDIINALSKKLRVKETDIIDYEIIKESIDARDKEKIYYVYELDVNVKNESRIKKNNDIFESKKREYIFTKTGTKKGNIIIVGAGPAGLFAAYILAENGYKPLIIERGKKVEERIEDILEFFKTNKLDVNSNVQFGEGGAGAFSDGKLNTMIKDTLNRHFKVFDTFIKCGAPSDIMYSNHPHIGTDLLRIVIKNMREKITSMGGSFRFNTTLTNLLIENGSLKEIVVNNNEHLKCDALVLAIGHSARDTFKMLYQNKLEMQPKPFAIGIRAIHSQDAINESQYGKKYKDVLPNASYKLTYQTGNRGVYTFCMCPGGYVINASSEKNRLAINGMSNHDRNSGFANSAIIVTINPSDFGEHPLDGIEYQRALESKAYEIGNGKIPLQLLKDFKNNKKSNGFGSIKPSFKSEYEFANLNQILPKYISAPIKEAFPNFGKKIKCFDNDDTVLAGIESRTSSPVRIVRNDLLESNIKGIYPCGEGAGYAGGITSAAIDGIKVAEELAKIYK